MTKKYQLTPEHKEQLKPWADKWTAIALRTTGLTDEDREICKEAMRGLYTEADLHPPVNELFCRSPLVGAVAASVSAGIWWLRENPDKHTELFNKILTEEDYRQAILDVSLLIYDDQTNTNSPSILSETQKLIYTAIAGEAQNTVEQKNDQPISSSSPSPESLTVGMDDDTAREVENTLSPTPDVSKIEGISEKEPSENENPLNVFLLMCCKNWNNLYNGGNQWVGWNSFLSFFMEVVKLQLPIYDKYKHYVKVAIHGGPRFMHKNFWIISDFPLCIYKDEQHRPHHETGPFCEWRDGTKLYYWHGVKVDQRIIEHPETITPEDVLKETNQEVRRVLLERYGYDKVLAYLGAVEVQQDSYGVLYETNKLSTFLDGEDELAKFVKVFDPSTDRVYMLRVPPEMKTSHEAVAWTFDVLPTNYQPTFEA